MLKLEKATIISFESLLSRRKFEKSPSWVFNHRRRRRSEQVLILVDIALTQVRRNSTGMENQKPEQSQTNSGESSLKSQQIFKVVPVGVENLNKTVHAYLARLEEPHAQAEPTSRKRGSMIHSFRLYVQNLPI